MEKIQTFQYYTRIEFSLSEETLLGVHCNLNKLERFQQCLRESLANHRELGFSICRQERKHIGKQSTCASATLYWLLNPTPLCSVCLLPQFHPMRLYSPSLFSCGNFTYLFHLVPQETCKDYFYFYPHFTEEKTEMQGRLHNQCHTQ